MRTRKTLNKPPLRKLALKLRRLRHEEHYKQDVWALKTACGTAACLAGHAAALGGWRLRPVDNVWNVWPDDPCVKGKQEEPIRLVAANLLGISDEHWLFSGSPDDAWPEPFSLRWEKVLEGTSKERPSRIAADLLDAIADGRVTL